MARCLHVDLRRAFINYKFPLSICMCALIYLLGCMSEIGATDILYILGSSLNNGAFSHMLPLVAVIPYASSFLEDKNTGYLVFVNQRVTARQYLNARFTSVVLAGALSTVLGMLIFLMIAPLVFPYAELPKGNTTAYYAYMQDVVSNHNWTFYLSYYAYLQFISGMFWSAIALTISVFMNNAQLLYLMVVIMNEVLSRILFSFNLVHFTCLATGAVNSESKWYVMGLSSAIFFGLTALCFLIYQVRGRRAMQHV